MPKIKPSKNVCLENIRTTVQYTVTSQIDLTVFISVDVYGWEERELEDTIIGTWSLSPLLSVKTVHLVDRSDLG